MDARHFDALVQGLSRTDTRRRIFALVAMAPVLGGLLEGLDPAETDAKERRRRRKQRHKRRQDHGKRKGKQGCRPKSRATVCAGKCGKVKSRQTCGKTVDCGACDCNPPCAECFTCQGSTGTCVPQAGTPCGAEQTCQDGVLQPRGTCTGSGVCVTADPVSCAPYLHCASSTACATRCSVDGDCVDESFCKDGQCVGDGANGSDCEHGGQCASGQCVKGICCNTACSGECVACDLAGKVGTCTPLTGTTCGSPGQLCQADGTCACQTGSCPDCGACLGNGTCQACAHACCDVCCADPAAICHGTSGACCTPEDPAVTCQGACGNVVNNCGQTINCTLHCAGCCREDACLAGDKEEACGTGGATCDTCIDGAELCTEVRVCAGCGEPGGPCRVFVTSMRYTGDLKGTAASGLAGADAICQQQAQEAGLTGTYMAWLSDGQVGNSPSERFITRASGPYRLVTGETVADNWEDLTDGSLQHAINVMADRTPLGEDGFVWTHTLPNGMAKSGNSHCNNWESSSDELVGNFGETPATDAWWTDEGISDCIGIGHLYCFQQS